MLRKFFKINNLKTGVCVISVFQSAQLFLKLYLYLERNHLACPFGSMWRFWKKIIKLKKFKLKLKKSK